MTSLSLRKKMFDLIMKNIAMHISPDEIEAAYLQSILQPRTIKKDFLLLRSGEICRFLYFVNKGCLRIFNIDSEGNEHNISFSPENWWAVDISSFSQQVTAFYLIGALEETEVLGISYDNLEKLYSKFPRFERFFRILTQNGFHLYQLRITAALSKTAEERYNLFQARYPGLEQRISQKHIASFLGITPVFLSRIRKKKYS